MTVRQLITLLAAYPPDAIVEVVHSNNDITAVSDVVDGPFASTSVARTRLLVLAERTEDNWIRRGGLEQVFDSAEPKPTFIPVGQFLEDDLKRREAAEKQMRIDQWNDLVIFAREVGPWRAMIDFGIAFFRADFPGTQNQLLEAYDDQFGPTWDRGIAGREDEVPHEFDAEDAWQVLKDAAVTASRKVAAL